MQAVQANAYDVWWQERRERNARAARQRQGQGVTYNTANAAERAAARVARAEAAKKAAAEAAASADDGMAPGTLPLDSDFYWSTYMLSDQTSEWLPPASSSVAKVLTEFVQSTYARQIFNNRRAAGTDYGQIRGMFSSIRLVGGRLELTPKLENVEGLSSRLAMYLRARIPQLKEIHEVLRDGVNIL